MTDKVDIEKVDLKSMDISEERRERLREIFPEVFTEKKVDFDKLKSVLGDIVETGRERYGMNWAGKADCLRIIQQPSVGTLKPCRKESVDFDKTENLFIEGDNLEVLKLLQKSYYGKVKMIYIDPPYNTGKDFIYPDNFSESLDTYLKYTGQIDDEGRKYSTNTDTDGRFHTRWINMMYPRLYLARNLLREDGVIFISIDDNEVVNLRKVCDEIFGEENFEGHIHWRRRHNQPNDPKKMIALVAEHIIAYSKNKLFFKEQGVGKLELTGKFSNPDNDHRGDWATKPWKVGSDQSGSKYTITTPTGKIYEAEWMGEESTYKELLKDNRIIFPKKGDGAPRKKYFRFEREKEGQCATNWWPHDRFGHNQGANDEMTELMGIKNVFSNPKPSKLIENLISISNCKDEDIVLDFFAGSCVTFHASTLFSLKIKSICVQLPEPLDPDDKEQKSGYIFCKQVGLPADIATIGKERIRRVIKKIKEKDSPELGTDTEKQDLGFKVFKLDNSNFRLWDGEKPEGEKSIKEQLKLHIDHIDPESKTEDILYELLLKSGFELTTRIEKLYLADKEVFSIEDGALLICLEEELTKEAIKAMAEMNVPRVICLDQGFKNNDQLKTNAVQIMKSKEVEFRTV